MRDTELLEKNTERELVLDSLVANHDSLKAQIAPLVQKRDRLLEMEPKVFHDDIRAEFDAKIRSILMEEVSKNLTISADHVMMIVEDINPNIYCDVTPLEEPSC